MAYGDDYNSGQPDNTGDSDVQRKKSALELILRAQQKPSISPVMTQSQPSQQPPGTPRTSLLNPTRPTDQGAPSSGRTSILGNRNTGQGASSPRGAMIDTQSESGLSDPNTKHLPAPGATPTNRLGPQNPTAQPRYDSANQPSRTPSLLGSRFQTNETAGQPAVSTASNVVPDPARPNIPATRKTSAAAPDINANAPFTPLPSSGKRLLGVGGGNPPGTPLLGLGRGAQPPRPDVMPQRSDFPEKKLPTWEKVAGIAAAPFMPGLSAAILTSPRRGAERQYEQATQDWQNQQKGAQAQATLEETRARTQNLLNPPDKQGVTGEEQTLHDLMTGGDNGGPKINPKTGKPYQYLEAYSDVQAAKTGATQGAKTPPLDPANIEQINDMHLSRYQTLNPGKPLPPAFTLRPGSTQADYDRIDKNLTSLESGAGTAAQREATNTARNQAELDRQEARRDRQSEKDLKPVYAYDEKTKRTILTTYGEAKAAKMPEIRAVKEDEISKDKQQVRQLADAQMNFSDYRMKALRMQALSGYEIARVGDLIGDSKFRAHFLGLELPSDWANELRQNKDWTALPEDAQQAVAAYIGARPAVISYLRAINPGVRINDTMINTEMKNVPSPTDPPNVQEEKFKRLQRNMDRASKGLVKMRDMDEPAEIRKQMEVVTPQAPNPAQPAQAARKGPKQALVDWLNRKVGAQ